MEQFTIDHTVILRPQVTIMQWVQIFPASTGLGKPRESALIKLKLYIQDQAKSLGHMSSLPYVKKISEISTEGLKQRL